ncbi:MAG: MGMT family protein [Oscillospiraceae bacterium]|nr:MGMT family protein [Oscillospiraceae bacterium]
MHFFSRVYAIVREIPRGQVATYGQIARLAGNPRMARQVGWALHSNPDPGADATEIPCHRVVFKDGRLCSGFAFGGAQAQQALLAAEKVSFCPDGRVDLSVCAWKA